MILVFDACALIALIKQEAGAEAVDSLLSDRNNTCVAHAVNLCEVYYEVARVAGEIRAKDTVERLIAAGLFVREDMDIDFWQDAGNLKAQLARISLADCFCVALANRLGTEILTSDHREFDQVAEKGVGKVRFLR